MENVQLESSDGSWCLQRHQAGGLARGVLHYPDAPRGAYIAPPSAILPNSNLINLGKML